MLCPWWVLQQLVMSCTDRQHQIKHVGEQRGETYSLVFIAFQKQRMFQACSSITSRRWQTDLGLQCRPSLLHHNWRCDQTYELGKELYVTHQGCFDPSCVKTSLYTNNVWQTGCRLLCAVYLNCCNCTLAANLCSLASKLKVKEEYLKSTVLTSGTLHN